MRGFLVCSTVKKNGFQVRVIDTEIDLAMEIHCWAIIFLRFPGAKATHGKARQSRFWNTLEEEAP